MGQHKNKIIEKIMKNVFSSKLVWFNIVMTLIDLGAYFQTIVPPNWLPYAVSAQGVGTIILRIWFTSKPLTFATKK